jgi:TRAP-type mannitol/chloroaromatic compound transport system permease small subunit
MIKTAGNIASWLTLILVIVFCIDVILRYLFNATQVWVIDLEWHLFGLIVLLSGGYSLLEDRHVRVDVFFNRLKKRSQNKLMLVGHIILLLPWLLVVIYASGTYAMYSFRWLEGSPDPGGLPARYIIKAFITIGFVLFLLAGIKQIFRLYQSIKKEEK